MNCNDCSGLLPYGCRCDERYGRTAPPVGALPSEADNTPAVRALSSEREAFEKWARTRKTWAGEPAFKLEGINSDGSYCHHHTQDAWMAWQARAERAAVPAASTCEHCQGNGVIFTHAEDCDDDLCALNGDMHSCVGQLIPCECAAVPASLSQDQFDALVRDAMRWRAALSHPPAVPASVVPYCWALKETLDARKTTANAYLWFSDPVNSSWEVLYRASHSPAVPASDSVHQTGALRMGGAAAPSGD